MDQSLAYSVAKPIDLNHQAHQRGVFKEQSSYKYNVVCCRKHLQFREMSGSRQTHFESFRMAIICNVRGHFRMHGPIDLLRDSRRPKQML